MRNLLSFIVVFALTGLANAQASAADFDDLEITIRVIENDKEDIKDVTQRLELPKMLDDKKLLTREKSKEHKGREDHYDDNQEESRQEYEDHREEHSAAKEDQDDAKEDHDSAKEDAEDSREGVISDDDHDDHH